MWRQKIAFMKPFVGWHRNNHQRLMIDRLVLAEEIYSRSRLTRTSTLEFTRRFFNALSYLMYREYFPSLMLLDIVQIDIVFSLSIVFRQLRCRFCCLLGFTVWRFWCRFVCHEYKLIFPISSFSRFLPMRTRSTWNFSVSRSLSSRTFHCLIRFDRQSRSLLLDSALHRWNFYFLNFLQTFPRVSFFRIFLRSSESSSWERFG